MLEYDATSAIGKGVLPEPPAQVSHLLNPRSIQALEGIIGHKLEKPFYFAQALVSVPTSAVDSSTFNAVTR